MSDAQNILLGKCAEGGLLAEKNMIASGADPQVARHTGYGLACATFEVGKVLGYDFATRCAFIFCPDTGILQRHGELREPGSPLFSVEGNIPPKAMKSIEVFARVDGRTVWHLLPSKEMPSKKKV